MKFNPFEDRKSRDVRNHLGHSFVNAIEKNSSEPFLAAQSEIEKESAGKLPQYLAEYMSERKKLLGIVMHDIASKKTNQDFFSLVCAILWNRKLFFEFHEWVEDEWIKKKGVERKVYQSLILAAIFYEHLNYGRKVQAEKVGIKASKIFKEHKNHYPGWIDTDLFLEKFECPVYEPPVLNLIER